mmetsp:Transcript_26412/g.44607  ORF Transcript_26412/g.44607 Transcript_26412/m.44607 type:complete len:84 (-) Transcript_26412:257-508(-)
MLIFNILATFCEEKHPSLGDLLSSCDSNSDCVRPDLHDVSNSVHVVSVGLSITNDHFFLDFGTNNVHTFHSMALLVVLSMSCE